MTPKERLTYHVNRAIADGAAPLTEIPALPHGCKSWIIEDTQTGKAVLELFNAKNVAKVLAAGPTRYRAHTALAWLSALNSPAPNTKPMGGGTKP